MSHREFLPRYRHVEPSKMKLMFLVGSSDRISSYFIKFFRTVMRISWGRRFGTCNSSRSMGFWRWNGRWRRRTWYFRYFPLDFECMMWRSSLLCNVLGELRSTWNAFAVSYRDNKDQSMTELWRKHFEEQTLTEVGKKLFIWFWTFASGNLRCYL